MLSTLVSNRYRGIRLIQQLVLNSHYATEHPVLRKCDDGVGTLGA